MLGAPMRPLLNVDAGELETEPEELYALADLVNVACGGHAGDRASMERVLRACAPSRTRTGAHPSFVDRERFGRVRLEVEPTALRAQVTAQLETLRDVARAASGSVDAMKLHGALYHAANEDRALAEACVAATREVLGVVPVLGPAGGALEAAARSAGMPYLREAFADRGVRPDGTLVPRGMPGALVEDPARAASRARELSARADVDTVCIHGDTPGALAIARAVRDALGPKP